MPTIRRKSNSDPLDLYFTAPSPKHLKKLEKDVTERVMRLSVLERLAWIQRVEGKKHEKEKYSTLLNSWSLGEKWKQRILSTRCSQVYCQWRVALRYNNDLELPFQMKQRVQVLRNGAFCSAFGSTFTTDKSTRVKDGEDVTLDAAYALELEDGSRVFALGDGSGGHWDPQEDRMIARAAHFATKIACYLFAAYSDAEELKADLPALMKGVCREIRLKAGLSNTTLAVFRVFQEEGECRVVGWNIGDNLLQAWNPSENSIVTLSGATRIGEVTALMCDGGYREGEIDLVDRRVSNGTHFFLMSDGAHDSLPHSEIKSVRENGAEQTVRELSHIESLFGDHTSLKKGVSALSKRVLKSGEKDRKETPKGESRLVGDDFAIIAFTTGK